MKKRFGIVTFPGSNCDSDCHYAVRVVGAEPVMIWHAEASLPDVDCIILPGGFSYGDYLRAGALVAASGMMKLIAQYAAKGGLVLGICNGFQILVESGLLPGALLKNSSLRFIHKNVYIKSVRKTAFSYLTNEDILKMPIAHSEGCYFSNKKNYNTVFKYCSRNGEISEKYNPNGSIDSVAGIINANGNVCGMMPHPERSVEKDFGSDDGLKIFESIIAWITDNR